MFKKLLDILQYVLIGKLVVIFVRRSQHHRGEPEPEDQQGVARKWHW